MTLLLLLHPRVVALLLFLGGFLDDGTPEGALRLGTPTGPLDSPTPEKVLV